MTLQASADVPIAAQAAPYTLQALCVRKQDECVDACEGVEGVMRCRSGMRRENWEECVKTALSPSPFLHSPSIGTLRLLMMELFSVPSNVLAPNAHADKRSHLTFSTFVPIPWRFPFPRVS